MSRNSTIELLNETDALGYRMRWQLFVQENERVVYGDYTGWQPGDFLHHHPFSIRADSHISHEIELEFDNVDGEWGNHVRPMFEIMGENAFHMMPGYRVYIAKSDPWCGACLVSWEGEYGDACWFCGLVSYGPYITQDQRVEVQQIMAREKRRKYQERQAARQAEIYAANRLEDHAGSHPAAMGFQRRSHAARGADASFRELYDRITGREGQRQIEVWRDAFTGMREVFVRYAEVDAEFSRQLFSYRVEHYPPLDSTMVFDIETFEPAPSAWEIMFGQARHEDALARRTIVSHPRRNGHSALRVWIDEWAGAPVPPLSPNVDVKVDDVTINIPRNWRGMRRNPPTPKPRTDIVPQIVERHKKQHPYYYRGHSDQVDSIAMAMRHRSVIT